MYVHLDIMIQLLNVLGFDSKGTERTKWVKGPFVCSQSEKTQFWCVNTCIFQSITHTECLFPEGAGEAPLRLFLYPTFGCTPAQSWSTWSARDSVNCRYLMAFLCAEVEKLVEVCTHSIAWLGLWMKTQRHCFQWSNPLYSNSTAFLSRIPKPPLLCEGFFFSLLLLEEEKFEGRLEFVFFFLLLKWLAALALVFAKTITELINHRLRPH